ncbi:hypothetical protein Hdeb2414_s0001g00008251 [Helianthus debilis subsp. tardiflorus]
MTDPSLCREVLRGVGTPTELARLRASGCDNLYLQHSLHLFGGSMTGNVILRDWYPLARKEEECDRLKSKAAAVAMDKIRASEERLLKEKADFEAYKRTKEWAMAAGHKQVRSLTDLLSEVRKLWKEAFARENENFYRLHQENVILKAANAALVKEKIATVAAMKDAEASSEAMVKALEEANVGHTRMAKTIEGAKVSYAALEVCCILHDLLHLITYKNALHIKMPFHIECCL